MLKHNKMELNNFEQHLKTSLHDQEEAVDVAKLMAAISPIKTRKKKKGLYIVSFLIFSVCIVAGGLYYGLLSNEDSSDLSELVIPTPKNSTDLYDSTIDNSSNDLADNNNNNNNQSSGNTDTNLTSSSEFTTETKTINSKKYINTNTIDSNNSKTQRIINIESSASIENSTSNESSLTQNRQGYRNNVLENVNIPTKTSIVAATSKLKSLSFKNLEETFDLNESLLLPKQVDCPTFTENPWIIDFGTVMGISNPTKTLTKKTTEILPAYSSRATNEKSLEGLDLELYISAKRARWPVFLKTGLNYSRWSERMKIEDDYTEIDTIQGIISITTSETGDTVKYIYGDIYVERDVEIRKNIHYYINRLDIPLSVVYEKEFGNHALQAELGTRVNFSTFARGLIYNEKQDFSLASAPSTFRKITGLNYFGKLHYRYYVTNNSYLGAQAYYQYIPADLAAENNNIGQKYTNYGLGIYYGFRF